jgi:hypothetical protein
MKNLSQPIRADGRRPTMILTDKKNIIRYQRIGEAAC